MLLSYPLPTLLFIIVPQTHHLDVKIHITFSFGSETIEHVITKEKDAKIQIFTHTLQESAKANYWAANLINQLGKHLHMHLNEWKTECCHVKSKSIPDATLASPRKPAVLRRNKRWKAKFVSKKDKVRKRSKCTPGATVASQGTEKAVVLTKCKIIRN